MVLQDVSKFHLTTDADTMKNDGGATASVTIPASSSIPAGSSMSWTTTVDVTTSHPNVIAYVSSSLDATKSIVVNVGASYAFPRTGSSSRAYNPFPISYRIGATTFLVGIIINNPYGSALATTTGETFTFVMKIFSDTF